MFRKFVVAAAVTAPACFRSIPQFRPAFADESEAPSVPVAKIIVEDGGEAEDDTAWALEKQECAFCRNFLGSPCRIAFRQWSKCADMSNPEEVAAACTDYTSTLIRCMQANSDYFQRNNQEEETEEEGADGEAEEGHSEPVIGAPATAIAPAIVPTIIQS